MGNIQKSQRLPANNRSNDQLVELQEFQQTKHSPELQKPDSDLKDLGLFIVFPQELVGMVLLKALTEIFDELLNLIESQVLQKLPELPELLEPPKLPNFQELLDNLSNLMFICKKITSFYYQQSEATIQKLISSLIERYGNNADQYLSRSLSIRAPFRQGHNHPLKFSFPDRSSANIMVLSIPVLGLKNLEIDWTPSVPFYPSTNPSFHHILITPSLVDSINSCKLLEQLNLEYCNFDEKSLDISQLISLKKFTMIVKCKQLVDVNLPSNITKLDFYILEEMSCFEINARGCESLETFEIVCHPNFCNQVTFYPPERLKLSTLKLHGTIEQVNFHDLKIDMINGLKILDILYPDLISDLTRKNGLITLDEPIFRYTRMHYYYTSLEYYKRQTALLAKHASISK